MALTITDPWSFANKSAETITSFGNLSRLVEINLRFEACVIQATVVEALLSFSLLIYSYGVSESERDQISRRLTEQTFGQLIGRTRRHSVFPVDFIKKLTTYKDKRNFLVHDYLILNEEFDYQAFLRNGETLLNQLHTRIRASLRRMRTTSGRRVLLKNGPTAIETLTAQPVFAPCLTPVE